MGRYGKTGYLLKYQFNKQLDFTLLSPCRGIVHMVAMFFKMERGRRWQNLWLRMAARSVCVLYPGGTGVLLPSLNGHTGAHEDNKARPGSRRMHSTPEKLLNTQIYIRIIIHQKISNGKWSQRCHVSKLFCYLWISNLYPMRRERNSPERSNSRYRFAVPRFGNPS